METFAVIVMIILFLLLMVFVFSTALLTPLIGKRNLVFVLSLGFIVGVVGGAFFIAPLYDDIPDMLRGIYTVTGDGPEIINLNITTQNDVGNFLENTKKIKGVKSIQGNRITMHTTPFGPEWVNSLQSRIPETNSNIKEVQVIPNDTLILTLENNSNPTTVAKDLNQWLLLVGSIDVISSIVEVSIEVDASQVDSVISQLPQDQVVVSNITGPTEDKMNALKENLPDRSNIIIICGFIGLLVGLAGVFIDSISQVVSGIRRRLTSSKIKKMLKKEKKL
jgi:hypothetical protein